MNSKAKLKQIFVSGGYPEKTYIQREKIRAALDNSIDTNRIIVVTGYTKSGKTVFIQNYLKGKKSLWVPAGEINDESEFWQTMASLCGVDCISEESQEYTETSRMGAEVKGQTLFPFATTTIGGTISNGHEVKKKMSSTLDASVKNRVLSFLHSNLNTVVVIDDFHYFNVDIKKNIIRSFKAIIQKGLNLVLIAIPNRGQEVVSIEKEMSGRKHNIEVVAWSIEDLSKIAHQGFECVGKDIDAESVRRMANESLGSPHLMQDFCLQLSLRMIDNKEFDATMLCPQEEDLRAVFTDVAEKIGKPLFSQLAKGPKRSNSRKQRILRDGVSTADIYSVVARALASLKPGMETIKYSTLMVQIKGILSEDAKPPQMFEVERVLMKMSEIAVADSASNPIIDVDKDEERIYISDPYFAYYLKWGNCNF